MSTNPIFQKPTYERSGAVIFYDFLGESPYESMYLAGLFLERKNLVYDEFISSNTVYLEDYGCYVTTIFLRNEK